VDAADKYSLIEYLVYTTKVIL